MKLSYSKISTYLDCPRKYWYQYVLGVQKKKSEGFFFGSAIHEGLEAYYRGNDPMMAVRNALFGKKLRLSEEAEEGVNLKKLYKEAERCFKIYPNKAPYFEPLKTEKYFDIPIIHPKTGEELNASLEGKIDLIDKRGFLVDHKTAKSAPNDFFDGKNNLQATAYAYAYLYLYDRLPEKFVFNYIIKGNTRREPSCQYQIKRPGIDEICEFFDLCKMIYRSIQEDKMRSHPAQGFQCKFCNNKSICPYKKD